MSTVIDLEHFLFVRLLILNWNLRRPVRQLLFLAVCGGFLRPNYFEYAGIRRVAQNENKRSAQTNKEIGQVFQQHSKGL